MDPPVRSDVVREWHEQGPALVTRGARGVYASGLTGHVDTVSAGDAFMAGLLAAFDRNDPLTRAALTTVTQADLTDTLTYAPRVAAVTCTRPGTDSPWFDDLLPAEVRAPTF